MSTSILVMREQQVLLDDVTVSGRFHEEAGGYLELTFVSDCQKLSRHGFALKIVLPEFRSIDELKGEVVVLRREDNGGLAESTICEPGQALEISALQLNFSAIEDGHLAVDFLAVCFRTNEAGAVEEENIRVLGCLNAEITA